ncbi:MAG: glycosyltransferase [Candidatus Krumholzibacteriia bacterium]
MRSADDVRVLMIDSETTWRGGQNQLALLVRGLSATGRSPGRFDTTLAAPPGSKMAAKAAELGIRCLPLPIRSGIDLTAARRLAQYLKRQRFDIVHCHSSHAHSIAFMAVRALRFGRRSTPLLVVSRRVDFPVARNGLSALKYRYGADVFLAISNGVRDALVQCGIEPERIEIVPSGIDLERHDRLQDTSYLEHEFGLGAGTTVIGNIAALAPHKSQVDFVRAAKIVDQELDGVRFLIVGEGKLRGQLESLIRELDMQGKIRLTGFRDDALEILSRLDCFVLSSHLEGLCTSIMDAQVLGIPVVATNTGGVPDLVRDGETGLLVPPREPERLAGAILRILREPGLKERCSLAARAQARAYDYRHMVRRTIAAYRRILGRTGTTAPPAR